MIAENLTTYISATTPPLSILLGNYVYNYNVYKVCLTICSHDDNVAILGSSQSHLLIYMP